MDFPHQVMSDGAPLPIEDDVADGSPFNEYDEAGLNGHTGQEDGAPRYTVPPRVMGAVEVPMIVADVDRATRAFGNIGSFKAVRPPPLRPLLSS